MQACAVSNSVRSLIAMQASIDMVHLIYYRVPDTLENHEKPGKRKKHFKKGQNHGKIMEFQNIYI